MDSSRLDPGTIPKLLPSHARDTVEGCPVQEFVMWLFVVDPLNRHHCYLTSVAQFLFVDKELQKGQPEATELRRAETGF